MLIPANSTDNILLVEGGIFHPSVFLVMVWMCSVNIYFDRGGIFLPFISCSFRCIFFSLRGKGGIFLPLLWCIIITENKSVNQ